MSSSNYPALSDAYLMGLIDQSIPAGNMIGLSLLPKASTFAELIEWDVKYGGTRLAGFVGRDAPARIMKPKQIKKLYTKLAYTRVKQPVAESVLTLLRLPGVAANDPSNTRKSVAAAQKIAEIMADLKLSVDMMIEYCIMTALSTGALAWNSDGVVLNVNYGIRTSHKITATTLWSDTTNADPLSDVKNVKKVMIDDGVNPPDTMIMNTTTYHYLTENATIRELMKYVAGDRLIRDDEIDQIARVKIVLYDNSYEAEDGTNTKILADGKVVFLDTRGMAGEPIGRTVEGPAKSNNFEPGMFAKSWDEEDPDETWVLVGDYFIPAITHPDRIAILTVL